MGNTCRSIDAIFLNRTPSAQEIRARIDKWDYINLKGFYSSNKIIIRMK
jgi:hypothetical protein